MRNVLHRTVCVIIDSANNSSFDSYMLSIAYLLLRIPAEWLYAALCTFFAALCEFFRAIHHDIEMLQLLCFFQSSIIYLRSDFQEKMCVELIG